MVKVQDGLINDEFDVAIVGAGISGCYCAYKFATQFPDLKVALFECSNRIGGRLFSKPMGGTPDFEIELGGMYFSKLHENVFRLADEFKLSISPVSQTITKHLWIRGQYIDKEDADDITSIFQLLPNTEKLPGSILMGILKEILPDLENFWPYNMKSNSKETLSYLRSIKIGGRKLKDWGFWSLIDRSVTNEAHQLMSNSFGSSAIFGNSNACDIIWSTLRELAGTAIGGYFRLNDGYQKLPNSLLEQVGNHVAVFKQHKLDVVNRTTYGFGLEFLTSNSKQVEINARKLILALPQRPIKKIYFRDVFSNRRQFETLLEKIHPVNASKLFLSFKDPWWNESEYGPTGLKENEFSTYFTDLPIQQCYYFGGQTAGKEAVIMASYADEKSASFWTSPKMKNQFFYQPEKVNEDELVQSAIRQLRTIHSDIEKIPDPTNAIFVDWSKDPYGGAWHAWNPYEDSHELSQRIINPEPGLDLYICGEAYSLQQGWVEGALQSVENMFSSHFNQNIEGDNYGTNT